MADFYCNKVLTGDVKVEIVSETANVLAFHHTQPYFERHVVIIPKTHISSLSAIDAIDARLALDFMKAIAFVSKQLEEEFGGCRVCSNVGDYQSTKHLHWYIHAGKRLRNEDGSPVS